MIRMVQHIDLPLLSYKVWITFLLIYLFLLGSHCLEYSLYLFVGASFFLIKKVQIQSREFAVLSLFILSLYITWIYLDKRLLSDPDTAIRLFSHGALIWVMYLLGNSVVSLISKKNLSWERVFFYVLFIFFIAYTLSILYSYMVIPQDKHFFPDKIVPNGMHVWFQNEYSRLHVHEGRLISTVIAYYLTFMAILFPFLILCFQSFRKRGFSYLELAVLTSLSLFAIYIANEMGRRTVLFLLGISFVYMVIVKLIAYRKYPNRKMFVAMLIMIIAIAGTGIYLISDTAVMQRVMEKGLSDSRYGFWIPALKVMWHYPFGGGHAVLVAPHMKLAHNTWIDIGKDFGLIPFFAFLLFCLMHIPYVVRVILSANISNFVKHQIVIMSIAFFAIMMIEPVFTSDKTFFAYIIFFLGILKVIGQKIQTDG